MGGTPLSTVRRTSVALALLVTGCGGAPAPRVDAVDPALFCDPAVTTVTVRGEGLGPVVVDVLGTPTLRGPTFRLEPLSDLAEGSAPRAEGPYTFSPQDVHLVDDGTVELLVGPDVAPGTWTLVITTPGDQEVRHAPAIAVAGPPDVAAVAPASVCHDLARATFVVEGDGFLVVDGVGPSVTVGGEAAIAVTPSGCAPLAGPVAGEVCTMLEVETAPGGLALGEAAVVVTNPEPAACTSTAPASVEITQPPEITAVTPDWLCTTGGTLTIEGENFSPDATVDLGEVEVVSVTWLDASHLQVEVGEGASGTIDVTVIDGGGCSATFPAALTLVGPPLVYAIDPPAAPSALAFVATARVANVAGTITDAWLVAPDGSAVETPWSWDAATPGEVRVAVPAGLDPGAWTVGVLEEGSCDGRSAGTLLLTDDPTLDVSAVDPAYAWTFDATPVAVRGAGFDTPPQVFFVSDEGEVARGRAVVWEDAASLRAVVPDRLPTGAWDVLVVNPDGAVGWLADGLLVTAAAPPTIDTVTPAHLEKSSDQPVVIRGQDFDDPSVSVTCREGGVETSAAVVVDAWDYGTIDATVPATAFDAAVCTVTVTNADGTSATWSALSITNPSSNLFPWQAGTAMNVARRGPAAAAGRTTSVSRYVYAIGGDDGDAASALSSVEVAPIGVYGDLGDWAVLPRALPAGRTLAGAVTIGRFVYLVGGDDGGGATDEVLRAQVLDPMDVPWFEDVAVDEDDGGQGLAPGTYTWRVSALFDAADPVNPGGESLAADLLVLTLPDIGSAWLPTLSWSPVPGAAGYRVYRDDAWAGDVTDPSFLDHGDATDPALAPLGDGALGEWAAMPSLRTERASPCLAVAADPRPDPETVYVYAAGGFDASGDPIDTVEILDVVIASDDLQTAGDWSYSARSLSVARGQCGGWTVDATLHDVVDEGETWVYFGGGVDERRATGEVDAGRVAEGGDLELWQEVDSMSPARAGFGVASASGFLYAFGGQNGSPSAGGASTELAAGDLPELGNWNSLGTSMAEARYLAATAQESAVIVILGGQTDDADATRSVDWTNF